MGQIIGETDQYILQRQSASTAVLHPKQLLDRQLETGEKVAINYSNGKGLVSEDVSARKPRSAGGDHCRATQRGSVRSKVTQPYEPSTSALPHTSKTRISRRL